MRSRQVVDAIESTDIGNATARERGNVSVAATEGEIGARRARAPRPRRGLGPLAAPLSLLLGLLAWQGLVAARDYPAYLLPGPDRVAARFVRAVEDGTWWRHTGVTLGESLLGFALGFVVVAALGYLLAKVPVLERIVAPYIAASQALPVIAIAPLLLLWFGFGLLPKVLVAALVVFFPMLVNTISGLRNIDPIYHDVALVYGASRWQTFRFVEVPLALPALLSGIKIGFTLAVTGATVAEFIGADRGIGVLLSQSKALFDTPLLFVALVTLVGMAMAAYGIVGALERLLIRW